MEIVTGLWRNTSAPVENQPARRDNLLTVTFPGFLSSRAVVAKYTGPDPVVILDHPHNHPPGTDPLPELFRTTATNAPRLVHNVLPLPDLDELDYTYAPWYSPLTWYNGLRTVVMKRVMGGDVMPISTNVPRLNNLGGSLDQAAALEVIKKGISAVEAHNNGVLSSGDGGCEQKLVLFGFSRGAATFLQASIKADPDVASKIDMVILEAPFDTLDGVINDSSAFPALTRALFRRAGSPSPPEAYELPATTHLSCPLLFITSDVDNRVPKKTTMRAIEAVRRLYPHLPVEHLELKKSMHSFMAIQDVEDRARYIDFMERMYDKYLPTTSRRTEG